MYLILTSDNLSTIYLNLVFASSCGTWGTDKLATRLFLKYLVRRSAASYVYFSMLLYVK